MSSNTESDYYILTPCFSIRFIFDAYLECIEQVIEEMSEVMGEEHPDTIKAISDKADMLEVMGREEESNLLRAHIAKLQKKQ